MKETYDLRLSAKHAEHVLGAGWQTDPRCICLSESVVQVKGAVGDELYVKARKQFQESYEQQKGPVVYGCGIKRTYTNKEIDAAELFLVLSFYQYGAAKEYGTWYTDAPERPNCGNEEWPRRRQRICALGSRQVGPMHYPFAKLMKRDLISLWGGETVVS